jgi:hypothetical protein
MVAQTNKWANASTCGRIVLLLNNIKYRKCQSKSHRKLPASVVLSQTNSATKCRDDRSFHCAKTITVTKSKWFDILSIVVHVPLKSSSPLFSELLDSQDIGAIIL